MESGTPSRTLGLNMPWGPKQWHADSVEKEASRQERARQNITSQSQCLLVEPREGRGPDAAIVVEIQSAPRFVD